MWLISIYFGTVWFFSVLCTTFSRSWNCTSWKMYDIQVLVFRIAMEVSLCCSNKQNNMTFSFSELQWRSPTFFFLFFSHHNAMDRCINKFWQVFVALSTSSFLLNRRESIGDLVTHNSQEVIVCQRQIQRQRQMTKTNTFWEHLQRTHS